MTATTQGRRAEVVAWLCVSEDGTSADAAATESVRRTYELMGRTITPLVPADTLAEMQRRVEACEALADQWESVCTQMGGNGTPVTDSVITICVRELRAILGGDGKEG